VAATAKKLTLVPDLAAVEALGEHRGRPISRVKVQVLKAGDGLSDPLQIDPQMFREGEKVYLVLETVVGPERYEATEEGDYDGAVTVTFSLNTRAGTIATSDEVVELMRRQADRVTKAKEEAVGVQRLEGTDAADLNGNGEGPWAGEDAAASPLYGSDDDD
jgi:hypothetical protein